MAVFFDPLSGNLISSPDSIQGGATDVLTAFAHARIDVSNISTPTAHTGISSAAHVYSVGVESYIDFTFDSAQPDTDYDVVVRWETGPEYHETGAKTVNGFRVQFYSINTGDFLTSGSVGSGRPVITVYASDPIVAVGGGVTSRALLGIGEYADDAAAGSGGVASGTLYYNTTSSDYRLKA